MAASEVSMQEMSEVVIVTLPDTAAEELPTVEEEDKAVLVTTELHTQPGENVLTVAAVEAEAGTTDSLCKEEEAVIVKLTEEVDVEADVFYPITCGETKANLVWKKFVCPGINVKCVQFNEQLISPKEFVCLAGKSTLKDWKRAIRLNGTMLRKIMDSGELDFYHHTTVCSNTCRSTKIDLVGTKVNLGGDQSADQVPATPSSADLNGATVSFPEVAEETSEWVTAIGEDSVAFWRGVNEAGLLEEVVEDFQKELQEVLKGLQERACDPPLQVKDAVLLNNIVQNFGMLDLVKKVLASHKSQMDRYREQYTRSLASLEQQCDEHRKRAKELKSKSQHLNNVLMTLAPVTPAPQPPPSPSPAAKRPRLTRAFSGPASISNIPIASTNANAATTTTQITLPLSQLAGLPLGKMLGGGGSYTLLTTPISGAELTADGSNVTVLSGQELAGGASSFVKLLGPQFQLVTLPGGLQGLAATTQGGTIGSISVVDVTAAAAVDGVQEESHVDGVGDVDGDVDGGEGEGGGHKEQVNEADGEAEEQTEQQQ